MQKIKIEEFNIIGIQVDTTNQNGQSEKDMAILWQSFFNENILNKIPNKIDSTIYALYTNYKGDYTKPYTAIIGCKVHNLNQIPEGLIGKNFTTNSFLKSTAKGNIIKGLVKKQWEKIWKEDINRAYTVDFEEYTQKAEDPTNAEVNFYISVL